MSPNNSASFCLYYFSKCFPYIFSLYAYNNRNLLENGKSREETMGGGMKAEGDGG
jgi:hypothetical protein